MHADLFLQVIRLVFKLFDGVAVFGGFVPVSGNRCLEKTV